MAFNVLPIEINQTIASYIIADKDLESFRNVCWATKNAVDDSNSSFWRMRFLSLFDPPDGVYTNKDLKKLYRYRQKILRRRPKYVDGTSRREIRYLNVLTDMVRESFNGQTITEKDGYPASRNILYLHLNVINNFPQLKEVFASRNDPTDKLAVLQLMLSHCSLSLQHSPGPLRKFIVSQEFVYGLPRKYPIFSNRRAGNINVLLLLHTMNFFKFHMRNSCGGERTLFDAYSDIHKSEYPRAWSKKLGTEKLGKEWKGTYAYLDRSEMIRLRGQGSDTDEVFLDKNIDEDSPFQDLTLSFPEEVFWPQLFEENLESKPKFSGNGIRAQQRARSASPESPSISFEGQGYDKPEPFLASGWVNDLPEQHGLPGWRRVVMMKYFRDELGNLEENSLWAYEGVIIPGGQIMLGRWWCASGDPNDLVYSGPFVFWNVDYSTERETLSAQQDVE